MPYVPLLALGCFDLRWLHTINELNYSFNLFKHTARNPIKICHNNCNNCKKMETKSFAYSTRKGTKTPITLQTNTTIVNQETCISKYQNCGAQYVGYSMRQLRERFIEHRTTYESPVGITWHVTISMNSYSKSSPKHQPMRPIQNYG